MSFIGTFQRAVTGALVAFLQDANVQRLLQSFGLVEDDAAESLAQGVRLSQPLRGDPSALPYLAHDRGIHLYTSEPEASRRYRLSRWWQTRRQFGTHAGELRYLLPAFYGWSASLLPRMRMIHVRPDGLATWHTLDPQGASKSAITTHETAPYTWTHHAGNWDWDGITTAWSRVYLIIYMDQLGFPPQPNWDDGQPWDGGSLWDGSLSDAQIGELVAAFSECHSAHSTLWAIILASDPTSFQPTSSIVVDPAGWSNLPDGKWYTTIDPVTGKPTRLPSCSVVYNRGKA